MVEKTILVEREGPIKIITFNRPEAANALNDQLSMEFYDAICECATDDTVRAVLLTGKGKMFCGGGDLKFLLSKSEYIVRLYKDLLYE